VTTPWYLGTRFNHHLTADMSQCTYVDARYEPNEMYEMSKVLGPGMTVLDVGANAGVVTLLAAALVGPGGRVHAFEPSPRDRSRLTANVDASGLTNVSVHAEALGRETGKAVLRVSSAERPGHNTIGGFAYAADAPTDAAEVVVTTLDEFVGAEGLTRLDFVKLDVEGSETAVLQGGRESLGRFRPVLITEAYDPSLRELGTSAAELLALLRDLGYGLFVFGPAGAPEPLDGDRLTGVNLLCLPR
jgi:FkbM family methyltransferase